MIIILTSKNGSKPTTTDVSPSATLADLQAGRTLFINNCGRCHGIFEGEGTSQHLSHNLQKF
ncbi:MAG: hypothetical protein M0Q53_05925 [Prolixibacteraceae bacterium]|nr:hypothetical protein [Prolixibacteraceae bacterium]